MLLDLMPNAEVLDDREDRPLGPMGASGLFNRLDRIPRKGRLSPDHHHHPPSVFGNVTPRLCRHRNPTSSPTGNASAATRSGQSLSTTSTPDTAPIPPRRQRMPPPATTGWPKTSSHWVGTSTTIRPSTRSVAGSVDHGVPAVEGAEEDAKLRGVERFLRFPGPNGLTQEIYTTARTAPLPLDIPRQRIRHRRRRTRPRRPHHEEAARGPGYYNHVFD